MLPTLSAPMLQFLTWVAERRRSHVDVLDAWQSSCPRLTTWEDAVIEGYVQFSGDAARDVLLTGLGRSLLQDAADAAKRPSARSQSPGQLAAGIPADGMRVADPPPAREPAASQRSDRLAAD